MTTLHDVARDFQEGMEPSRHRRPLSAGTEKSRHAGQLRQFSFEAALEHVTDAVILTDAKGYVRYVNAAFETTTGYTRGEIEGGSLHVLDGGRHDPAFFHEMREALQRDGAWQGLLTSKKKDGSLYQENCRITPVRNPAGEILHYLFIRRDIMGLLKLESIAERVDAVNNVGYIVSGVRHEIGNAINSLGMIISVLKAKLDVLDNKAVRKYLDRAEEQVSSARYTLCSLRNCSMFEKPALQNVDLSEFLARFISLVKEDFVARGIETTALVDTAATFCLTDPQILHQILLNLVINASDAFTGRVHPQISIFACKAEDGIKLRVKDNGCGMSEGQIRDAFKPFFTTKVNGTGLGLVIVKKLITAVNGSIAITSRKDAGTIVEITLPGEAGSAQGPASRL